MSLLLYGIVEASAAITHGEEMLIQADGLSAVAVHREQIDQDLDSILAYGKVVERIYRQTTLIPMRYGNLLPDEAAVIQHLILEAERYRQRLAELEGCEEMGIRLAMPPQPAEVQTAACNGHEYLLARKRKYLALEQVEQHTAALDIALSGLYRKRCAEAGLFAGQTMYLLSYLVPRAKLQAFRETLEKRDDVEGRWVSGPWPPYNFAC
ncbi:MAG: GvpL/GvpF family gas vesicle protein [Methylococcaceae bacterium]|nr:GvpL/GvpF family gas vesicle protein [Methylococcaceae bacterium]